MLATFPIDQGWPRAIAGAASQPDDKELQRSLAEAHHCLGEVFLNQPAVDGPRGKIRPSQKIISPKAKKFAGNLQIPRAARKVASMFAT